MKTKQNTSSKVLPLMGVVNACLDRDVALFKLLIKPLSIKELFEEVSLEESVYALNVYSIWHATAYASDETTFLQILLDKIKNSNYPFDIDTPVQKGELEGWTAYHLAFDYLQPEVMEFLAINGANPNSVFKAKNPCVHLQKPNNKNIHVHESLERLKLDKSGYNVKSKIQKIAKKAIKEKSPNKILKI